MPRVVAYGVAAISLAVLWVAFELRYVWHVDNEGLWFLRAGIGLCATAILACWVLFPSRVVVALLGLIGLVHPPLIDPQYPALALGFLPYVVVVLVLLVTATHLLRLQKIGRKAR